MQYSFFVLQLLGQFQASASVIAAPKRPLLFAPEKALPQKRQRLLFPTSQQYVLAYQPPNPYSHFTTPCLLVGQGVTVLCPRRIVFRHYLRVRSKGEAGVRCYGEYESIAVADFSVRGDFAVGFCGAALADRQEVLAMPGVGWLSRYQCRQFSQVC